MSLEISGVNNQSSILDSSLLIDRVQAAVIVLNSAINDSTAAQLYEIFSDTKVGNVLRPRIGVNQRDGSRRLELTIFANGIELIRDSLGKTRLDAQALKLIVSPPGANNFLMQENCNSRIPSCGEDWCNSLAEVQRCWIGIREVIEATLAPQRRKITVLLVVRLIEIAFDVRVPRVSTESEFVDALEHFLAQTFGKVPSRIVPRITSSDRMSEVNLGRVGRGKGYIKVRGDDFYLYRFELVISNVRETGALLTKVHGQPTSYLEDVTDLIGILKWAELTYKDAICNAVDGATKWLKGIRGMPDTIMVRMAGQIAVMAPGLHREFVNHLIAHPYRAFRASKMGGRIPKALIVSGIIRRIGYGVYQFDLDQLKKIAMEAP